MKFHKAFSIVLMLALLLSVLPGLAVSAAPGIPDFGPNVNDLRPQHADE